MLQVLHELWNFYHGGHPCPKGTFLVFFSFIPLHQICIIIFSSDLQSVMISYNCQFWIRYYQYEIS